MANSFEVHVRFEGRWNLEAVEMNGDQAMTRARTAMNEPGATGAKVIRSFYDATRNKFVEEEIFSDERDDPALGKLNRAGSRASKRVCSTVEEFYGSGARAQIAEAMGDTLAKFRITPTEILYDRDLAYWVQEQGNIFQGAVQRAASTLAREGGSENAQQLVRRLYALVDQAWQKLRGAKFRTSLGDQDVAALQGDPFGLMGALIGQFRVGLTAGKPGPTWEERLIRLTNLTAGAGDMPVSPLLIRQADELLSDMIFVPGFIEAIWPGIRSKSRIQQVETLLAAARGAEAIPGTGHAFQGSLEARTMPASRAALIYQASQVLNHHGSLEPLEGDDPSLADVLKSDIKAVAAIMKLTLPFGEKEVVSVFEHLERRAADFVSFDRLGAALGSLEASEAKIDYLLEIDGGINGTANRLAWSRQLMALVRAYVERPRPTGSPIPEMMSLARWERLIMQSDITPNVRIECARILDLRCADLIKHFRLIDRLRGGQNVIAGAIALFDFVRKGGVTHGDARELMFRGVLEALRDEKEVVKVLMDPEARARFGPRILEIGRYIEGQSRDSGQRAA